MKVNLKTDNNLTQNVFNTSSRRLFNVKDKAIMTKIKSMCNVTKKIVKELTTYESQFKKRRLQDVFSM